MTTRKLTLTVKLSKAASASGWTALQGHSDVTHELDPAWHVRLADLTRELV